MATEKSREALPSRLGALRNAGADVSAGEGEAEHGALALSRFGPEPAALELDEVPRQRQSEARASDLSVQVVVELHELGESAGRSAFSIPMPVSSISTTSSRGEAEARIAM